MRTTGSEGMEYQNRNCEKRSFGKTDRCSVIRHPMYSKNAVRGKGKYKGGAILKV